MLNIPKATDKVQEQARELERNPAATLLKRSSP